MVRSGEARVEIELKKVTKTKSVAVSFSRGAVFSFNHKTTTFAVPTKRYPGIHSLSPSPAVRDARHPSPNCTCPHPTGSRSYAITAAP